MPRDWLEIAKNHNRTNTPPKDIEESKKAAFLLNGYANLYEPHFKNDQSLSSSLSVWNITKDMMDPSRTIKSPYGVDGLSVLHALNSYPLKGMKGIVIGSEEPWVEMYALLSGAEQVLTTEYRNVQIIGTDKLSVIHPIKFAENWIVRKQMFDFAISFSSIEHSGLGRYGDPVDPIGDLREVMKTMCILKKHGLFFLGLPRNQDGIHYNTHRFYGRIRLAMVMTGFEWLNTFEARSSLPLRYKREDFNYRTDFTHDLFVLRKL